MRHSPCATARVGSGRSSSAWANGRPPGQLVGAVGPEPLEHVHVDARAHHVTLRAEDQRARQVVLDLRDRGLEVVEHRGPEEVERRRVEHELADVAMLLIEALAAWPGPYDDRVVLRTPLRSAPLEQRLQRLERLVGLALRHAADHHAGGKPAHRPPGASNVFSYSKCVPPSPFGESLLVTRA